MFILRQKDNELKGKQYKATEMFVDWDHKESGWRNIEPMARDMQDDGYGSLFRKVAGVDLFATELCYHRPCYLKFYSKHQKWKGYHKLANADKDVGTQIVKHTNC